VAGSEAFVAFAKLLETVWAAKQENFGALIADEA
jgi:hypothetical protein